MAKIQPLEDRVVVQVLDAETKTAGGIILPDSAQEKPQRGKVTSVGSGRLTGSGDRSKMTVKKGDTIIFGKYAGTDVEVAGSEFKILKETEILARIES